MDITGHRVGWWEVGSIEEGTAQVPQRIQAIIIVGNTAWATAHVWLHNIGLPIMIGSLTLYVAGHPGAEPLVALGSVLVFLGLLAFAVKVFRHSGRLRSLAVQPDRAHGRPAPLSLQRSRTI